MEPIRNFDQLTSHLKTLNKRKRIAVVCADDPNTEYAISRALDEGIAEFLMIGSKLAVAVPLAVILIILVTGSYPK